MRGSDEKTGALFSYVDLEARVRRDHPLRAIRQLANDALAALQADFSALYSGLGRPSIPPERLLRAMLLQAFYSIRSERQMMERLDFDLLFRWFVGLGVDDPVWDHSTFSKNRDRLLEGAVAARFLSSLLAQPRVKRLLSTEHFSVDGTLIEAWASMKSFKPTDGSGSGDPPTGGGRNAEADFRGQKRSNETHVSTTDPDAKLYRRGPGQEARLAFLGHALMENRSGLLVDACVTRVSGHAERVAALAMIEAHADRPCSITLGADRGYDAADFVNELRSMNVRPHVARNLTRRNGRSAIDGRTTRHAGYAASQRIRKRIEESFGWIKTIAGLERPMVRGVDRVGWAFTFAAAAYNLVRLPKHGGGDLMARHPAFARAFTGRWRITLMDTFPDDVLDVAGEAHLTFTGADDGEIAFIAVRGFLDVRDGSRDGVATAEFSFEGTDDGDPISGRGWVAGFFGGANQAPRLWKPMLNGSPETRNLIAPIRGAVRQKSSDQDVRRVAEAVIAIRDFFMPQRVRDARRR